MKTKTGEIVPEALAAALKLTKGGEKAWACLRPSCQADFIERVAKIDDPDEADEAIDTIVRRTLKYGAEQRVTASLDVPVRDDR